MREILYTYSLIKSFYEQGSDYIDSFWPLVLMIFPSERRSLPIDTIKKELTSKYGLDIPSHALITIIKRAKRNSYISQNQLRYTLTPKGLRYREIIEKESDVSQRIDILVRGAVEYLRSEYSLDYTVDEINSQLIVFIRDNIEYFEQYVNPNSTAIEEHYQIKMLFEHEEALINYFIAIEQNNPDLLKTLQDIISGSIISVIVNSSSFRSPSRSFDRTYIFLDTNIIFSILDMDHQEFAMPAQELFKLMVSENTFKFYVFDFTIVEIIKVLNNFNKERFAQGGTFKVASVFDSLRAKGWGIADVKEFIIKIEETLSNKGINIYSTNINLDNYASTLDELRPSISRYKPHQGRWGQNHDLAAIEIISSIRKSKPRRIEKAKALFLTSDIKLATFNFNEMKHKELSTISEVIPDRVLTNMLWLKNPSLLQHLPLKLIIAMHSRNLFINNYVWKSFYHTIEKLRKSGDISERDITILLYDQNINDELRVINPENADKIDDSWIMINIEAVKTRLDYEKESDLKLLETEYEQKLSQKADDFNEFIISQMANIKFENGIKAAKVTKRICALIAIVTTAALAFILYKLTPLVLRKWDIIEPYSVLIHLFFTAIPVVLYLIFGNYLKRIKRFIPLYEYLYNHFLRMYLSKIKYDDLKTAFEQRGDSYSLRESNDP